MNHFEFKKTLRADPYCQDPEFVRARNEDIHCRREWKKALEDEKRILAALKIPVPRDAKNDVIFNQCTLNENTHRMKKYAIAASAFLVIGMSWFIWQINRPNEIQQFIKNTMLNSATVYLEEEQIPIDQVQQLFANFDTDINAQIGKVHFMKMCITPNGTGVKMVVMNDNNQPYTLLYMPETEIQQQIHLEVNDKKGAVIALEKGSVAIIGHEQQEFAHIENSLLTSIKPAR